MLPCVFVFLLFFVSLCDARYAWECLQMSNHSLFYVIKLKLPYSVIALATLTYSFASFTLPCRENYLLKFGNQNPWNIPSVLHQQ